VTSETDGEGVCTKYEYDDSNRVTSITENAGVLSGSRTVSVGYETTDDGTVTTETDALGHQNIEKVNESGLVTESKDVGDDDESIITKKTYDANGNLAQIVYANGAKITNTYNAAGMLTEVVRSVKKGGVDQVESKTTYIYQDNRLTEMVDWKMQSDETYQPWHYTCYNYDTFGRTKWIAEIDSSTEPTEEQINEQKISYVYDAEDNVIQVNYAQTTDGIQSVLYDYDANQRLQSISVKMENGTTNLLRSYTYDSYGNVSGMTEYPGYAVGSKKNAVVKSYSYDDLNRVISMVYKKAGTIVESYQYEYDKNSNITKAVLYNQTAEKEANRVNETRDYTYDALGQLIQTVITEYNHDKSTRTISYTYDKAGNRISMQENGETAQTTSYVYNGLDQLLTETTVDGSNTSTSKNYEYDENGNQIRETDGNTGVTVTNSYDAANQLTQVVISQNGTDSLTQKDRYNGSGQRVRKTEISTQDGQETTETLCYHYQDGTVSYTTEGTGEKQTQYILGAEGVTIGLEQTVSLPDEETSESKQYYVYDKDIQGSTTSILDSQGDGMASYEYTDFGETTIHESSTNFAQNEICYTGGIYDASTGLYYLNARYYDPSTGVFLTQDSYRGETNSVDTWNLYAYCNGNPVNYVDPSGHNPLVLALPEIVAIGAIIYGSYIILSYVGKVIYNNRNSYRYMAKKIVQPQIILSKGGKQNLKRNGGEARNQTEAKRDAKVNGEANVQKRQGMKKIVVIILLEKRKKNY
jgi:RHS repeat-associated protein